MRSRIVVIVMLRWWLQPRSARTIPGWCRMRRCNGAAAIVGLANGPVASQLRPAGSLPLLSTVMVARRWLSRDLRRKRKRRWRIEACGVVPRLEGTICDRPKYTNRRLRQRSSQDRVQLRKPKVTVQLVAATRAEGHIWLGKRSGCAILNALIELRRSS